MSQAVAEQTLEGKLENAIGPLAEIVPQFELSTIQHSDQIMRERRTNPDLRNTWFYTADGAIYTMEQGKKPVLYLTRGHANPVFKNLEAATSSLIRNGIYIPNEEHVKEAVQAKDTIRVELSSLKLERENDEFSYFTINTSKPNKLNDVQRSIAWRAYGESDEFLQNMQMLKGEGSINETRIWILNPEYVKSRVSLGGSLARASRLDWFDGDSWFSADDRDVGIHGALRGVRRKVAAEGGVPQIDYSAIVKPFGVQNLDVGKLAQAYRENPDAARKTYEALGQVMFPKR